MSISVEDLLAHSFCITIDNARYCRFSALFNANRLMPIPQKVIGLRLLKNNQLKNLGINRQDYIKKHISAVMSHRMIVSIANAMNFPYVGIFEDDAVPRVNVYQMLQDTLDNIPNDTDILILGNLHTFGTQKYNDVFDIPTKTFGLQSYIVFKQNYANFMNMIDSDTTSGLSEYGKHVYLVKQQLFVQYSTSKTCISGKTGFLHFNMSKDFLDKEFRPQLN